MEMKLDLDDFLTFEDTGEEGESEPRGHFGFTTHGPIVSVKLFGVEVERAVFPHWGTEDQGIDTNKYQEKAAAVLAAMWMASEESA